MKVIDNKERQDFIETTVTRKIAQKDLLSRKMMTNPRKFKQRSAEVARELEEFMAWAGTINVNGKFSVDSTESRIEPILTKKETEAFVHGPDRL